MYISICAVIVLLSVWATLQNDKINPNVGDTVHAQVKEQVKQSEGVTSAQPSRYTNSVYNFSFELPQGYAVTPMYITDPDLRAEIVTLVVEKADKNPHTGLQITISPFAAGEPTLTGERISKEAELTLSNIENVAIGNVGNGLRFSSNNPDFGGASTEAWFVARGFLYQVSTYSANKELLNSIISTWNFQ